MNVYDFDNTIYDGESTLDFFFFCLKKNKSLITFFPPVMNTLIEYKMCRITTKELENRCEKYIVDFISKLDNPYGYISEFWDKHEHKIKDFYKKQQKKDDVIISASTEELLKEICRRLGIRNLIASKADFKTGKVIYMCHNKNKVDIFKKLYPDSEIDEFYTDSKNDMPMVNIAKKAFFVKGNKITQYK